MRSYILIALLLTGCPSPGLHIGLTGVRSQDGFALNTAQQCQHAAEATRIADRVLTLSLHELAKSGHVKSYHQAVKQWTSSSLRVCLVQKPEKCSGGGWTRGPFGPTLPSSKYPLAARKRGCASMHSAWSSICWPPICRTEWPDEPHCVEKGKASSVDWESNFIHEVFNVARVRWAGVSEADYLKLPKLFGKDGVKSKVIKS